MKIVGLGTALPEKVLTNDDLTEFMDTSDEWIVERTGIKQRHIGGSTSGLAIEAAEKAIQNAGISPDSIEQVILATTTPDQMCPGTAPTVADALGLNCAAFDVQAACSGWVYGLVVANGLLMQNVNRLLLIGSETLDAVTDYTDRGTGILFGNGAGAAILERDPSGAGELLSWDLGSSGRQRNLLYVDHGEKFVMDGREVFRQAVTIIQDSVKKTLDRAGVTTDQVSYIVPHQANVRIIELAWRKLGFSMEQTAIVLDKTGNTSAASIPLALHDAVSEGNIQDGDLVLFIGFGAGMTWGSALIRWSSSSAKTNKKGMGT